MNRLSTRLSCDGEVWTLELDGAIDSNATALMGVKESGRSLLEELTQAGAKKLLIDLTKVEFIDSHGLRVLLNTYKEFSQQNIPIILHNPNSHLKRLLKIMQFDRVFIIETDS